MGSAGRTTTHTGAAEQYGRAPSPLQEDAAEEAEDTEKTLEESLKSVNRSPRAPHSPAGHIRARRIVSGRRTHDYTQQTLLGVCEHPFLTRRPISSRLPRPVSAPRGSLGRQTRPSQDPHTSFPRGLTAGPAKHHCSTSVKQRPTVPPPSQPSAAHSAARFSRAHSQL